MARGRGGAEVGVRGDRVHHGHPYIQKLATSPVELCTIHQQPQERPNRDSGRGEVDRARRGTVERQEGEVGVEAEGSPGRVVEGGRGGAGVEVTTGCTMGTHIYTQSLQQHSSH